MTTHTSTSGQPSDPLSELNDTLNEVKRSIANASDTWEDAALALSVEQKAVDNAISTISTIAADSRFGQDQHIGDSHVELIVRLHGPSARVQFAAAAIERIVKEFNQDDI